MIFNDKLKGFCFLTLVEILLLYFHYLKPEQKPELIFILFFCCFVCSILVLILIPDKPFTDEEMEQIKNARV